MFLFFGVFFWCDTRATHHKEPGGRMAILRRRKELLVSQICLRALFSAQVNRNRRQRPESSEYSSVDTLKSSQGPQKCTQVFAMFSH